MTNVEIATFIERMEEIGDVWEEADVKRVYGDYSLADALNDRMGDVMAFGNIVNTIINGAN